MVKKRPDFTFPMVQRPERPTEPPATPPPSGGIDPAKARWDELLRLLRSINDNIRKVLDAEHQGLETVGVEPRVYIETDSRTLAEVREDADKANGLWMKTEEQ